MGFVRPSPIQLHALPVALFGNDVIGQAKSGTGKTAVFGVTAIEHAIRYVEHRQKQIEDQPVVGDPLALILAPTREIAVQIETVLRQLAQFRPEVVIRTCIGGLPVAQDQRVVTLCAIRLLVLDEVDKLMTQDFEKDIQYIADALPERRQIVRVRGPGDVTTEFISSAEDLENWKKREQSNAPELWLRHVRQFYSVVKSPSTPAGDDVLNMKAKVVRLAALLSEIVFVQCMVFCNDKFRAEALATALAGQGWPAACITGSQTQATRLEVMEGFRKSRSRVLVSTDLTARGIDVDKVNFVVNLDLPRDPATYLHRVGRSGRFGGKGLAVTLLSEKELQGVHLLARVFKMNIDVGRFGGKGLAVTLLSEKELQGVHLLARVFKMNIDALPNPVPPEIYTYATTEELSDGEEVEETAECVEEESEVVNESNKYEDEKESTIPAPQLDIEDILTPELGIRNKSFAAKTSRRYDMEEKSYESWVKLLR
ncbi:DEAD/DEAH box RNA helicase [Phytophthora megakarya]|uniref:RNA helicase n=1 Tax=Phytophthora megakarya TaxID=4795 RepID=A0A225WRP0_9STRA|nr:DEAD/DEAH box RNA helicase [Phytophthora megakarya]